MGQCTINLGPILRVSRVKIFIFMDIGRAKSTHSWDVTSEFHDKTIIGKDLKDIMSGRPRTTSFAEGGKAGSQPSFGGMKTISE
jgi:hypothetical protein